ncbi:MAG: hypothetical protein MUF15_15595 [Acidobacteria bacterium]|jgi:hypothetical protein|nr:hypothetical protein [Acidobacteriota bacterium]
MKKIERMGLKKIMSLGVSFGCGCQCSGDDTNKSSNSSGAATACKCMCSEGQSSAFSSGETATDVVS